MSQMVYAVVRRPYGNYDNEDEEKLLRMFATQKEADEYVTSQVASFRPTLVRNRNDCDEYEYGMIDTDTVISKVEFPQYVIRPFYIEGEQDE